MNPSPTGALFSAWWRLGLLQAQARWRPAQLFNLGELEATLRSGDPVVLLVPPEQLLYAWHQLRLVAQAEFLVSCPEWEQVKDAWPSTPRRVWLPEGAAAPVPERQTVTWFPWSPDRSGPPLPLEAWSASGAWLYPLWARVRGLTESGQSWPGWGEKPSLFVEEQGMRVGSETVTELRNTLEERVRRLQQGAERV